MLQLDHSFQYGEHLVRWGSRGDGPPLVLVHGTPFSSQVWRKIVPCLERTFRLYFFDLLGYGQSQMENVLNVSLEVQNGLLAALIREWGLTSPHMLAHDFGGATALRGHYLNGQNYESLTLIDPVAVAPWGSPFVQHVRLHEAAFSGMPGYAHQAVLQAYIQGASYRDLSEDAMTIHCQPWQGETGQRAFYRQIAQMDQKQTDEIEQRYGKMPFPVKLLWGAEDTWIPLTQGQKLANLITDGELTVIPEAGHLVQEDAPEAIVAAMLA